MPRELTISDADLTPLLNEAHLQLSQEKRNQMARYLSMLLQWNKKINLTGFRSAHLLLAHLLPECRALSSLLATLPLPKEPVTCDLGAGAGLPGILLRLFWEAGTYTMIEVREKRALFLAQVLMRIQLPRTFAVRTTVEEYFERNPTSCDLILSKAFLPYEEILQICPPFLSSEGILCILATREAPEEELSQWKLLTQVSYVAAGKKNWIWALGKK